MPGCSLVMHRLVGAGRYIGAQLRGVTQGQTEAGNRNALWTHLGWLFFPWPVVIGVKPCPLKYYFALKNTGMRWDEGLNPMLDLNPF